jgi:hypothetical protein
MNSQTLRKTGVYVLLVLPLLGIAGIAVIAQQHQDSSQQTGDAVADAARKAREQKKSEPKPKKVFTNDDVAPAPAAATPAATAPAGETKDNPDGAPAKTGDAAAAAGTDKPASTDNSEAGWRKRFAEQRAKITQAEQELDILQREAQKLQVQYYSDPQKALAEQYTRKDVTDQDAKIQAKKDEIAKLKQHLSDMEDDLRKSGGDSGWAR